MMQNENANGFWERIWSALLAMEGQHAEQTDMRLAIIEREIETLRQRAAEAVKADIFR